MKKIWLFAGLFFTWFATFSQKNDTTFTKKKLTETEVQVLFSYYTQEGKHSAVTGGTGTEKLQVYAPNLTISQRYNSLNTVSVNAGVDIISSASTDKIDFVVSSASVVDARGYSTFGYNRAFKKSGFAVGGTFGFSLESDYYSTGTGLSAKHTNKSKSREITLDFQANFDDLRWGRVNPDYQKPVKLIYPKELRYREWYDTYKRNSYTLGVGIYQVINQRNAIEFYPGITYQKGLLATPFHRVYFNDGTALRVENLPSERIKTLIGIQLNSFIGSGWILRSYYRFYYDNFGISAHTLNFDSPVKINATYTLTPFVRLYTQTESAYFKAYAEHTGSEIYYTSDYDLSAFNSIKLGLGLRYAPYLKSKKGNIFNELNIRYAFYQRSDGLHAHMVSLLVGYGAERNKEKKL